MCPTHVTGTVACANRHFFRKIYILRKKVPARNKKCLQPKWPFGTELQHFFTAWLYRGSASRIANWVCTCKVAYQTPLRIPYSLNNKLLGRKRVESR